MLIKKKETNLLDKKTIDNIRGIGIDMINEAGSGHPGVVLGAAPTIYSLYANHLRFDINNPNWINRDRFVLSGGHASALLYSILYMSGFSVSLDDLKKFRKLDSITPGHPEKGLTPGVDSTTGALGQGISNAVGMALASKYLSKKLKNVIDYNVYCMCGDGDLMEGISYEACSLAGTYKLDNLTLLYDSNDITLDGKLSNTFLENIKARFESMNWYYILVSDGDDIGAINDAINSAKASNKPTIIEIKTIIGKYSMLEGTSKIHGGTLSDEDTTLIKQKLGLRDIPFQVSDDCVQYLRDKINNRMDEVKTKWMNKVTSLDEKDKELFDLLINSGEKIKIKDLYYEAPENGIESPRETSGKILNQILSLYPYLIGGSCDVATSTKVDFSSDIDRCINFGIREHSSAGICNGLALCGLTAVTSTFLAFSDYMKPSIRMSSIMNLPVIYVFTHDSIFIGGDGITHGPVEQLVGLRAIPNLDVYRPSDANEVLGTYKSILESRNPSAIILSKNDLKILKDTKVNDVKNGAYIIKKESKKIDLIIISCGEELHLAIDVSEKLKEKGIDVRVVSMPSIDMFDKMDNNYKNEILPECDNTFVIEASSSYSWDRFVSNRAHLFTIDKFGISAPITDQKEKYNYTEKYIESQIEKLIK
ncbi:MAG: transketolase [bacterium]|nr:transketolase [bacterium]